MDMPGYVVLSRLAAQQRATAALAMNIANADTPGYKSAQMVFGAHIERQTGVDAPRGGREVAFAQDRATWRDFTPGSLQATGNPLDLALGGEGFFAVQTPNGERYTRAGRFALSPEGGIVDIGGNPVLNEDGAPLVLPQNAQRIDITGDGQVRTEQGPVGRLRVVNFQDPQKLIAQGDRLFEAPAELPAQPVDAPRVVQGSVEGSNVQSIVELTRLTAEMREFQFASQFIETEGDRAKTAVERILKRPV